MLRYFVPLTVITVSVVAVMALPAMPQPWPQLVWYAITGLYVGGLACLLQLAFTPASDRSDLVWLRWLEAQRHAAPLLMIAIAVVFIGSALAVLENGTSTPPFWFGLLYFTAGQTVWLIKLGRLPPSASLEARAWRLLVRSLIVAPTVLAAVWLVWEFLSIYPLSH